MTDLRATCNFSYAVVMLAHDGVANPGIWERWLEHINANGRHFQVTIHIVTENNVTHESPFLRKHDMGIRQKTSWGDISLVKAYCTAVGRLSPQSDFVFFVSGFDVPLVSAAQLGLQQFSRDSLFASFDKDPKANKGTYSASQWIHLKFADAKYFADNWQKYTPRMEEDPAEHAPMFVLRARTLKQDQLTDAEYYATEDLSPITFRDWDTKQVINLDLPNQKERSLFDVVTEDIEHGYFFFRKVAPVPRRVIQHAPWF